MNRGQVRYGTDVSGRGCINSRAKNKLGRLGKRMRSGQIWHGRKHAGAAGRAGGGQRCQPQHNGVAGHHAWQTHRSHLTPSVTCRAGWEHWRCGWVLSRCQHPADEPATTLLLLERVAWRELWVRRFALFQQASRAQRRGARRHARAQYVSTAGRGPAWGAGGRRCSPWAPCAG